MSPSVKNPNYHVYYEYNAFVILCTHIVFRGKQLSDIASNRRPHTTKLAWKGVR